MADEAFIDGARDEVYETEHGEDTAEHGVVDDGRRAVHGFLDHVARESDDEEGPEELKRGGQS